MSICTVRRYVVCYFLEHEFFWNVFIFFFPGSQCIGRAGADCGVMGGQCGTVGPDNSWSQDFLRISAALWVTF